MPVKVTWITAADGGFYTIDYRTYKTFKEAAQVVVDFIPEDEKYMYSINMQEEEEE